MDNKRVQGKGWDVFGRTKGGDKESSQGLPWRGSLLSQRARCGCSCQVAVAMPVQLSA